MLNVKLTIQYDGSNYSGWQRQKNSITIQEEIEKAIQLVTGERANLLGSGRTDRGVHAKGQVANFLTDSNIPVERFKYALNGLLPMDISITESLEVDESFHSRYDAIGKRYKYIIYNGDIRNPLYRNYTYHVPYGLDQKAMETAAKDFIGTHDFSTFMAAKSTVKDTIRTINTFTIERVGDLIIFTLEGNGFLYNMVRIIIGTLVQIGKGKIDSKAISHIIALKDRRAAGPTAPPQGLYLDRVYY